MVPGCQGQRTVLRPRRSKSARITVARNSAIISKSAATAAPVPRRAPTWSVQALPCPIAYRSPSSRHPWPEYLSPPALNRHMGISAELLQSHRDLSRGPGHGPLHGLPRHRRDSPAPGGARLRRPRPPRGTAAHTGGRVRLRRSRGNPAEDRRSRDQVRRPRANHPGRRAFVSGKKKQNAIKTTAVSDIQGRLLWSGADRSGRMRDRPRCAPRASPSSFTSARKWEPRSTRATGVWPTHSLTRSAPRQRNRGTTHRSAISTHGGRCADGSPRIGSASSTPMPDCGSGGHSWRPLQRYTGRRQDNAETHRAIACLLSDCSAHRPTRRKPSTELVLAPTGGLLINHSAEPPGQHVPTSIADRVVTPPPRERRAGPRAADAFVSRPPRE